MNFILLSAENIRKIYSIVNIITVIISKFLRSLDVDVDIFGRVSIENDINPAIN